MINQDEVISALGLRKFGAKGWYSSQDVLCKECGRSDKTGIRFIEDGAVVHCMRCSIKEGINSFLIRVGLPHLIKYEDSISLDHQLVNIWEDEIAIDEQEELKEKRLPMGFKQVENHPYLDERGFLPYHYNLMKPGISKISHIGMVIIQIFDERGVRVGWIARSTKDKEWHKDNLRRHHEEGIELKLRYENSPNTDFSKMIGGIEEVTDNTHTLILVEGLFDKVNVDKELSLDLSEEIKCNFTFGDSIKEEQIEILKRKKGLKRIYLLYDNKTINESKRYGLELFRQLDIEIRVCEITYVDADPGNLKADQLLEVLEKSVEPILFKINKLNYV